MLLQDNATKRPKILTMNTATIHTFHFPATDGYPLGATQFDPLGDCRATLLLLGATAVSRTYYRAFGQYMAARGLRTLTFDYRGIGGSRPESLRGFDASMTDWAQRDAAGALDYVRAHFPNERVIVVGHSFGGQVIGLLDALASADAAVLVAAQLGSLHHWEGMAAVRVHTAMRAILPVTSQVLGWVPGWMGLNEDLPGGVAEEWSRWCRHPNYFLGYVSGAAERFARFKAPTLLYSFTDDDFAPSKAIRALRERLSGASVVHRRIRPVDVGKRSVGHFGFFRESIGVSLWEEVTDFVEDVLTGREVRARNLVSPSSCVLTENDVMKDLEFGRE
jgi:predicted alpha/beta hydrolase